MVKTKTISKIKKLEELIKYKSIIRPVDLDEYDIPRRYLNRLAKKGKLNRVSRGIYVFPERDIMEQHTMAQVCKRVPKGIVCLLSALQFHEITTQNPFEVWLTIDKSSRQPREVELPIRIMRSSGEALTSGIEKHIIEGVEVKVYSIAKTVADCFKYRNKVGLDVALDALKECVREKHCTIDEINYYAEICRVGNVINSYLEAIL